MIFTQSILVDGKTTKACARVDNFRYAMPLSTKVEVGSLLIVGNKTLEAVVIGQASNHLMVEVKERRVDCLTSGSTTTVMKSDCYKTITGTNPPEVDIPGVHSPSDASE